MYLIFCIISFLINDSTKVIQLNENPLKENLVSLKEVITLTNDGNGFYKTIDITLSPKNEIIVLDRGEKQFHIYNLNGNKLNTFGTEGTGPGELAGNEGFILATKNRILTKTRSKIMIFDYYGNLVNEITGQLSGSHLFESKHGFRVVYDGFKARKLTAKEYDEDGNFIKDYPNKYYEYSKKALSLTYEDNVKRIDEITNTRLNLPRGLREFKNGVVQYYQGNYKVEVLDENLNSTIIYTKEHKKVTDNFDYLEEKTLIANGYDTTEKKRAEWLRTAMRMVELRTAYKNGFKDDIVEIVGESQGYLFLSVSTKKDTGEEDRHFLIDVISPENKYVSQIDLSEAGISNSEDIIWATIRRGKLLLELNNDEFGYYLKVVDIKINAVKSVTLK